MKPRQNALPLRAGGLTLLLTAVLICLALLAVLSLATARADASLSARQLQNMQAGAQAEALGQQFLADVDAALRTNADWPTAARRSGNTITADLAAESGATLHIALQTGGDGYTVTQWQLQTPWQPEETLNLWNGQ